MKYGLFSMALLSAQIASAAPSSLQKCAYELAMLTLPTVKQTVGLTQPQKQLSAFLPLATFHCNEQKGIAKAEGISPELSKELIFMGVELAVIDVFGQAIKIQR